MMAILKTIGRDGLVLTTFTLLWFAGLAIVAPRLPDYLSSYFSYLPIFVGCYLFWRCSRTELNTLSKPLQLFVLAGLFVPLANTVVMKILRKGLLSKSVLLEIFRPEILLILGFFYLSTKKRDFLQASLEKCPPLLKMSLGLALIGWVISTLFADHTLLALGTGLFDLMIPYGLILVLVSHGRRIFPASELSLGLVFMSLAVMAFFGVYDLVNHLPVELKFVYPLTADDLLWVKGYIPAMRQVGNVTLGNSDNFISLFILIAPFFVFAIETAKNARARLFYILCFIPIFYLFFCFYSRSGLGTILIWCILILIYFWKVKRRICLSALAVLLSFGLIHNGQKIGDYYTKVMASISFAQSKGLSGVRATMEKADEYEINQYLDYSAFSRLDALANGFTMARENFWWGLGYGAYPIYDTKYTAPHSLLLLRWVEGGFLSGLGFFLLCLYCLQMFVRIFMQNRLDGWADGAIFGASAFVFKGFFFGANFSILGIIIWGFVFAIFVALGTVKVFEMERQKSVE